MFTALSGISSGLRQVRLRVLRHRRPLAALTLGVATWIVVQAAMAPSAPTTPVWTIGRDLPGGTVVGADDLVRTDFLDGTAPAAAVSDPAEVIGRPLAHSVDRGQPVSEAMVVGERWVETQGATVVPVRISDPAVVPLLRVGDQVDLYGADLSASPSTSSGAKVLAESVRVAALPDAGDETSDSTGSGALPGRMILLAVPSSRVSTVMSASARQFLSVAWSH